MRSNTFSFTLCLSFRNLCTAFNITIYQFLSPNLPFSLSTDSLLPHSFLVSTYRCRLTTLFFLISLFLYTLFFSFSSRRLLLQLRLPLSSQMTCCRSNDISDDEYSVVDVTNVNELAGNVVSVQLLELINYREEDILALHEPCCRADLFVVGRSE